ncbi:hypothetical protein IW261DRAFT_1057307 [Armillaria novae-zelandiae]|uniref:Uncharacterized protein n=1 Tax=Armillaria novae-zelandiae TaxID=153914 RepID=A0AA39NL98_9AGAR|nr:hypothetical protein IW261DRAFT_1057307 [Armillaria novae-zelandiae]
MVSIPPELFDAIVDETQNDETAKPWERWRTLLSCSLVNRTFVPRARKHIYRSLVLTTGKRCRQFYDICQCSPVDIPSLVESLCIDNERLDSVDSEPTFPFLIASFVNMKSVHLRCLEWDEVKDTTRQALASYAFQSISFDVCQFTNSVLLCSFISGSSATLRQLSFARCEMLTRHFESFGGLRPSIERLVLYGQATEVFDVGLLMSKTLSPVFLHSLRILDICINTLEHIHFIQAFLDRDTVPFRELKISHLQDDYTLPFTWTNVLLRLTNLHSLTIILRDYRQNPHTNIQIFLWWIKTFESLGREGSSLEHIKIRSLSFPFCPWRDLDHSLVRLKTLRSFELEVARPYFEDEAGASLNIEHQLPGLMLLKIAHVLVCEPSSLTNFNNPAHGVLGPFVSP